jgi:hypothetical protein
VSVVLPASGCEMIANVRRSRTPPEPFVVASCSPSLPFDSLAPADARSNLPGHGHPHRYRKCKLINYVCVALLNEPCAWIFRVCFRRTRRRGVDGYLETLHVCCAVQAWSRSSRPADAPETSREGKSCGNAEERRPSRAISRRRRSRAGRVRAAGCLGGSAQGKGRRRPTPRRKHRSGTSLGPS